MDTNPESLRLAPMVGTPPVTPEADTSSDKESGGVGLVGVPPDDPPPMAYRLYEAEFFRKDDLRGVRGVKGNSRVCGLSRSMGEV